MKKALIALTLLLFIGFAGYGQKEKTRVLLVPQSDSTQLIAYTVDVMTVIDGKCLGCHSPGARNDKSKSALQWEQLQSMNKLDAYAKMDAISEVLEEGSMPPSKMVEKYPGMKLSEEEVAVLKEWVENTLTKMEE